MLRPTYIGRQAGRRFACTDPSSGPSSCRLLVWPRSKTPNPYTTHSFRLSGHPLAVHINRMYTLPGKHHMQKTVTEWMKWNLIKNVNVWCFSPCILEVDAVDVVFSQIPAAPLNTAIPLNHNISTHKLTQLNSTQPEITDAGVNISISASLCSRFL